jgi:hypothetical protein
LTAIPSRSGISVEEGPANNLIGGTTRGARNVIVGYGADGFAIRIRYNSHENLVQGNYIGCDKDGMKPLGDTYYGVLVNQGSERNLIGGTAPGACNVVAAHQAASVAITFADENLVQGNYIGINAAGDNALGAGDLGISVYAAASNLIGGTAAGARNVVSGNYRRGIILMSEARTPPTIENRVQGNYIGTDATGRVGVGAHLTGVAMAGIVENNVIGLALDGGGAGNRIAFNHGDGVLVYARPNAPVTSRNTIRGNLCYKNAGLDINLQAGDEADNIATPNDRQDRDAGPNNGQNAPVIANISVAGDKAAVVASVESTPNTRLVLDFYRSAMSDGAPEAVVPEYLGSSQVTTDRTGKANCWFKSAAKPSVAFYSATATSATTGDTGEFSKRVRGAVPTGTS